MDIKKGIKNISYSIVGQIISLVIGILIPRLVIVSYGSEVNGLLSATSTIISYLALLEAGVGAATCQALYKPISDRNRNSINAILSATNYYYKRTGVAYLGLIVVIAFLYPLVISSSLGYWFMFIIVFINGIPGVINFFFQRKYISFLEALGENYIVTNLQTAITVIASVLKIVLLRLNVSIVVVQAIYCFTSLGQMIYISFYIKNKYGWINVKSEPNYQALKQKNAALIHQVCSLITNSTDVIVLSIFCDLQTVSIYTVYNMVFAIVYNTIYSVNSGVQYALGQAYCKGTEYYECVLDAYETYYVTVASALLSVTFIMITPFLKLYTAGADINYVDKYLPILFILVKLFNSFRNSSINTITVSGHFDGTRWHAIIESILNLCVSLISVWKFGMIGVLLGTIVAFAYRCIVAIRYANRIILNRSCTHAIWVIVRNLGLVAASAILLRIMPNKFMDYFTFFVTAGVLTIVVLVFFISVNSFFDVKSYTLVKNVIKNRIQKNKKV